MSGLVPFLLRHGYLFLFGMVLVEQAGLPIPSVPVLLAVGALIGMGRFSTGNPRRRHSSKPPASGRTRVIPRLRSRSATRALVASLGQVQ